MALPIFYHAELADASGQFQLDEENSRHIISVLRMKKGGQIRLTDGMGHEVEAELIDDQKKHCTVSISASHYTEPPATRITIAISLIKNSSRFEWFLEKATEIGVTDIAPLICERTEKEKFRLDRLKGICVSAMLQSQQVWLPALSSPIAFREFINENKFERKFIAHCADDSRLALTEALNKPFTSECILIGPEGDFSSDEIRLALEQGFVAVQLGSTRLRTETAGVVAGVLMVAATHPSEL